MSQDKSSQPEAAERVPYDLRPDYTREPLVIPEEAEEDLREHLVFLYGEEAADRWMPELLRVLKVHHAHKSPEKLAWEAEQDIDEIFTEKDFIVITYGDMFKEDGQMPLELLRHICQEHMKAPNTLHILPFFPYSSDRGFAVTDFTRVDPSLGDWSDIRNLAGTYKLMFDGVLNHISAESQLFYDFLDGRPEAERFFIAYDSPDALTPDQRRKIFRPRTSDILTPFDTLEGKRYLWTTFSADQIDLNYREPEVLIAATEALLLYARMGAELLRLDAVTYIWAEPGTECVHLPQTHEVVKSLRTIMDLAAPGTAIITETNVPHKDNISYFGNGHDEAHMVYNFALPPLALYTFFSANAHPIANWARELSTPSPQAHFFNILDTHDGIGILGAEGILTPDQIDMVIEHAQANGALISYKMVPDGSQKPYEINSTWWSVLNPPDSGESMELQARRFAASRSLNLMLRGVPGDYMHGGLGTENDWETYERTKHPRDLNRADLDVRALLEEAQVDGSKLNWLGNLLQPMNLARVGERAFHPSGGQKVLDLNRRVFGILRTSPDGGERVLALTNVSPETVELSLAATELGEPAIWRDLFSDTAASGEELNISLAPYQVMWLKAGD